MQCMLSKLIYYEYAMHIQIQLRWQMMLFDFIVAVWDVRACMYKEQVLHLQLQIMLQIQSDFNELLNCHKI